ncbi:MAG: LysE family transporter [Burkholderiales bacterium]|nr:LysE family transporter [Burkholderiales bacterium]
MPLLSPAFSAGMVLSLSLIMAIGPQNAHVLRMGLQRQHVWLTVGICIVADVVLIALGVLGLAQLGGLSDKLQGALVGGGVLFLSYYGWGALQRCLNPKTAVLPPQQAAGQAVQVTRRQAVLSALAFSWLNPHAWIDTAVLIGTASLAYGAPGNTLFGLGAAVGSTVWFLALGVAVFWLGRRLGSPGIWRALDGVVAIMMWGTALFLLGSLF